MNNRRLTRRRFRLAEKIVAPSLDAELFIDQSVDQIHPEPVKWPDLMASPHHRQQKEKTCLSCQSILNSYHHDRYCYACRRKINLGSSLATPPDSSHQKEKF